ncbi:MAG: glycosyltransferase family 2 protein [Anaerolineaceae bacterium]|nr:glycosyltransferase family 2 protein [Anaerolineaceae bacterium]
MNNHKLDLHDQRIGVVIPAYKVEKHIAGVITTLPQWVKKIIVVNDCSPDATSEIVRSITDPRIHLIEHPKNQGVGGAMLSGFQYALQQELDILVKMDGDGQMDPNYLPQLIAPILEGKADYTKGNRFLHPVALQRMPFFRMAGNLALTFMTKLASGYWNIFDPNNGYLAISMEKLRAIEPRNIARNYFFETSMLCELRRLNAVVEDVAIPAIYKDEKSSMNLPREFFNFLFNLSGRFFKRMFRRYFLYDFNAASFYIVSGILLGLFGGIWGIAKWAKSSQTGIPATTGTVLIAVLPIILAIQFLVQAVAQDIADVPTSVRAINDPISENGGWEEYPNFVKL